MTTLTEIQRHVGVKADGIWGRNTAAAIGKALGIRPSRTRQINAAGEGLIKAFEGVNLKAYPDPATGGEPWTIGWGHTGGVKSGDRITQEEADRLFDEDTDRFEAAVDKLTGGVASDNQFAAMVSLAYNVGVDNFRHSTLLRKHNEGDYAGAANEFARWNKAAGHVMKGLTRRRAAEAALYRRADA